MQLATRITCGLALAVAAAVPSPSQSQVSQLAFEIASIKPNKSDAAPYSNFPLNAGGMYTANGGLFSATNFPLVTYIFFAYNLVGNQAHFLVPQLPGWVKTERFDIQARASGNPSKDQMRLMMQSLLAERFQFAIHTERREVPVLAFVLAKPGKTGPQLQPHPADAPCQTSVEPTSAANPIPDVFTQKVPGGFPAICNSILGIPPSVPGRSRLGGRNVTIGFMADMLSQRMDLGRPMIDATGLAGTFDFLLEYTPEPQAPTPPGLSVSPVPDGSTFEQALGDQLGLKLESRKSSMEVIVLDHVQRPSEN
jgi:bla regulator protein BlaR1